jgi:hypothetical protein
MNRIITLSMAGLMLMGLATGCCNDPSLKAGKAKSLVKKEMARTYANEAVTGITVGYYECNDPDVRFKLRQLAANEVITYSCDRVKKAERVRKSRRVQRYSYFYSYYDTEYYYVNDTVTTYFVTVAMTDKGMKFIVEDREVMPTADEKELRLDFEPDLSKYPEANVEYDEFPEAAAAPSEEVAEETPGVDPDMVEASDEEEVMAVDSESEALSEYQIAKSKENTEVVRVKAFDIKVVKVRNIKQNNDGVPTAKADLLVEACNVTPFGRIASQTYDGERELLKDNTFVYYQDKGWQLEELDD